MSSWPGAITAITLFVEDLEVSKQFYRDVFDSELKFEDEASAVFAFGGTLVNLLRTSAAEELIGPAVVAPREAGSRLQFTLDVDDVDAMCTELERGAASADQRPDGPAVGRPDRVLRGSRPGTSGRSRTSRERAAIATSG